MPLGCLPSPALLSAGGGDFARNGFKVRAGTGQKERLTPTAPRKSHCPMVCIPRAADEIREAPTPRAISTSLTHGLPRFPWFPQSEEC